MRREDSIFSISDRLTEVLAKETLTDDLDRKWFLTTRTGFDSVCCLWPPPCLLILISMAQIILYIYNSVAEHPLVLHPVRYHEPWRYFTYFLGKILLCGHCSRCVFYSRKVHRRCKDQNTTSTCTTCIVIGK